VGFTEGNEDAGDPGTYTISTDHLHSWVEVPFGDYGWLAFEPTPGQDNPVASRYQEPEQAAACRGRACGQNLPGGGTETDTVVPPTPRGRLGTPGPVAGAGAAGDRGGSSDVRGALLWAGIALALAGLVAVPLARSWFRRRRIRRARGEPRRMVLATYDVLAQRAAELGAGRGPGETPSEYLYRLQTSGRLDDGPLARLTALATRAAYAPAPLDADDALDAEADAREVLRSLRRTTPPLQRLTGAYRPRG
jgi:Domain of unknown function (DUF4129)